MKKCIKVLLLILTPLIGFNQTQINRCWLPQRFVDSIVFTGEKSRYNYLLYPIECFNFEKSRWFIQTFKGMDQPLECKTDSSKIPIKELALNLKYFSQHEQDSINKLKYLINVYSDSLILEEHWLNGTINFSKFICEFDGYKFNEPRETMRKLLFQGRYEIFYNNHREKVDSPLHITLRGDIIGSSEWFSYNYIRVLTPDEKNIFYDLVEFRSKKGEVIRKLAFSYDENEKTWVGYEYKTLRDKYRIQISPGYALMMKKL